MGVGFGVSGGFSSTVLARQADLKTSAKQLLVALGFYSAQANRALFTCFVNKQDRTYAQTKYLTTLKSHNLFLFLREATWQSLKYQLGLGLLSQKQYMPGFLNTDVRQPNIGYYTLWVCGFCLLSYHEKELSNTLMLAGQINEWPPCPPMKTLLLF